MNDWTYADTIGLFINIILIGAAISLYFEYQAKRRYCLYGDQQTEDNTLKWLIAFLVFLTIGFLYHRSIYVQGFFGY